jgi:coproporphyrinogen III oxidase-like Fe-S oxidoreductase
MYKSANEILKNAKSGFEHYEVSNYAKPGFESRHNLKYWACEPVFGFGLSAASYLNGERYVRANTMEGYRRYVHDMPVPSPDDQKRYKPSNSTAIYVFQKNIPVLLFFSTDRNI